MVQALLMILAGTMFFNLRVKKAQIFRATLYYGLAIWGVRSFYAYYHIPYGTHTLLLAIIHTLILYFTLKQSLIYCLAITGFSFSLIMLGGGLVGLGVNLARITIDKVLDNVWLNVLFGQLENILLIVYLFLGKLFNLTLDKMVRE